MIYFDGRLQRWDCYETFLLYMEYLEIQGNVMEFEIPDGEVITAEMMIFFLNAAYFSVGKPMCLVES